MLFINNKEIKIIIEKPVNNIFIILEYVIRHFYIVIRFAGSKHFFLQPASDEIEKTAFACKFSV